MIAELMNTNTKITIPELPETPYMRAKQAWDQRIGSAVIQAYNWRKIAFSLTAVIGLLVVGLIMSNLQPKYIPYIVEVSDTQVTNVAPASRVQYQPKASQIKHYLIKFVEKIRGVSSDHEVNKKWLGEAYSFLTPKTAHKFDHYFTSPENPMVAKLKAQQTVFVGVTAFTGITNNVYQLQWTEDTHDGAGKLILQEKLVGFATIKIAPPTHEQSILQNPLGIWIVDFAWSKVMSND